MAYNRTAVSLDDRRQLSCGEAPARDPAGELVVPNTVMSAQELAIRLREVRDHIAIRERERSARGLRRILMASAVRQRGSSFVKDENECTPISCCCRG